MFNRFDTFRDCRTTISLSFLQISTLCTIHCGFYGSLNTQNRMCELCTFSQIRSHIYNSTAQVHPIVICMNTANIIDVY